MIRGTTKIIAHIGYPVHTFKSPMIYNPYFADADIDCAVVPMACQAQHFEAFLPAVFSLENVVGALITMPHKVSAVAILDSVSPAVTIAGSCNAVKWGSDGYLVGDMFDGEGFVRGVLRKGCVLEGAKVLVVGTGGVGCAIASSLAKAGVLVMQLFDVNLASATRLAARLQAYYPALQVGVASNDPSGFDLVVNATPLGMNDNDPLPIDVLRLDAHTFVGEVVLKRTMTPLLTAARARGCRFQVGADMLYEQIPAYLEFFDLPTTTADHLRFIANELEDQLSNQLADS